MELRCLNPAAAAEEVAARIQRLLRQQGGATAMLLPTGATPRVLYAELRRRRTELPLDAWHSFQLDEYWPCPPSAEHAFRHVLEQELYQPLALRPTQVDSLDGSCHLSAVEEVCAAYEARMQACGGIGLAILGIGINGHLAFNEPGTPWDSRTRLVELAPSTRTRPGFPGGLDGPRQALTVGLGTILEAKRIVLLAFGAAKAPALRRLLDGPEGLDCPATCLRRHPQVDIYADEAALLIHP